MTKQLKSLISPVTVLTVGLAVSGFALADSTPYNDAAVEKEEAAGFLSGAAIGAAAGGPPGAIVGAAIGAFIGDGWVTRNEYKDMQSEWVAMQLEMESAQQAAIALEEENKAALDELEALRNAGPQVLPAYLSTAPQNPLFDNTTISVHFRSGSSEIESHYETQLASLVRLAQQLPNSALEITGYADRNGDAANNMNLSRQRSNSVKQFIANLGVEESAISAIAYGESQPLHPSQSYETDFFDRRVLVRLIDTSQQMLSRGE
jgi:sortase system peptidoglycan-associated protein